MTSTFWAYCTSRAAPAGPEVTQSVHALTQKGAVVRGQRPE